MPPVITPSTRPGTSIDRAARALQAAQPGITYEEAVYNVKYMEACYGGTNEITGHPARVLRPADVNHQAPQAGPSPQQMAEAAQELMAQCRSEGRAISATEAVARVRRRLASA
jgi:hypothetical protein